MISYISGKIIGKQNQAVVIITGAGVGYEIRVSPVLFLELSVGSQVELHTYLAVRENAMELYGFKTEPDKCLFTKFLDVSGVGPKSALHLLSLGTVEEISSAISRGDVEYLTKVSGVGKRTAERIVVELKNKLDSNGTDVGLATEQSESLGDVIDALISLGYKKEEARVAVKDLSVEGKTSEELLREVLKTVS